MFETPDQSAQRADQSGANTPRRRAVQARTHAATPTIAPIPATGRQPWPVTWPAPWIARLSNKSPTLRSVEEGNKLPNPLENKIVDAFCVTDTFVSGLGSVEPIGGNCFRFTFYVRQFIAGHEELVAVAKLIAPAEAVPEAILIAAQGVGLALVSGRRGSEAVN